MKKLLVMLLMAVAFCGSAEAQKGMQGVGANFAGNAVEGIALGGGVKYQYNISNYLRIEPSFSYYAVREHEEEADAFEGAILLNMHLFFSSPRVVRPYAFLGVGYVGFKDYYYSRYDDYGYELKERFGVDGGLGLDWRMTHNLSLQVEGGVLLGINDDDAIGPKINIGICYNF